MIQRTSHKISSKNSIKMAYPLVTASQITIWWIVTAPYLELRTRASATAAVLTGRDIFWHVLCYCVLAVMLRLNKWTYPYFTQYFLQFWVYYLDVNFVCIVSCWSTVMPIRQCKYWFLLRIKNATVVSLLIFFVYKQLWQKICQTQGLSQGEIVQWPWPPNRSIEWTFYEKFSFYVLFCHFQWASNMPSQTSLGSLRRSPRSPSLLERGHPLPIHHPLGAFGASILAPSALRSSCPRGSLVFLLCFRVGYGPAVPSPHISGHPSLLCLVVRVRCHRKLFKMAYDRVSYLTMSFLLTELLEKLQG